MSNITIIKSNANDLDLNYDLNVDSQKPSTITESKIPQYHFKSANQKYCISLKMIWFQLIGS